MQRTPEIQQQRTQFENWTENLDRHLFQEGIQIAKIMDRCPISLVIRELQIRPQSPESL